MVPSRITFQALSTPTAMAGVRASSSNLHATGARHSHGACAVRMPARRTTGGHSIPGQALESGHA
jgi:hypothetical protein